MNYSFSHEPHASALKASRCVQIHVIVFSLLALRLCRIRCPLLMAYQKRKGISTSKQFHAEKAGKVFALIIDITLF